MSNEAIPSKNNKFWLEGEITEASVTKIIKDIQLSTAERLFVYINSGGGCYDNSKFLMSFLSSLEQQVITCVIGECYSGAVLVALSGDERWATPLAKFMIHEAYDSEISDEIENLITGEDLALGPRQYQTLAALCTKQQQMCQKTTDEYYKHIADYSGLTVKRIKASVDQAPENDWYFTAKEALKYHVIDNIGLPPEEGSEVTDGDQ